MMQGFGPRPPACPPQPAYQPAVRPPLPAYMSWWDTGLRPKAAPELGGVPTLARRLVADIPESPESHHERAARRRMAPPDEPQAFASGMAPPDEPPAGVGGLEPPVTAPPGLFGHMLTDRERRRLQRQMDADVLGVEGLLEAYSQGSMAAFVQLARQRGMFVQNPDGAGGVQ